MIASVNFTTTSTDRPHDLFLTILPRIRTHARIYFRDVACAETRADRVAETIALAYQWFQRLAERDKDATQFPAALATLAARAVGSGRRLAGIERVRDVMSRRCQRRHGFSVESLPASPRRSHEDLYGAGNGQRRQDEWEQRLVDNTATPPDEQAMFRCDFHDWLKSLSVRERQLVRLMARNERTKDLARRFGVSAGRISQQRRSLHDDWRRFTGDVEAAV